MLTISYFTLIFIILAGMAIGGFIVLKIFQKTMREINKGMEELTKLVENEFNLVEEAMEEAIEENKKK